MIINCCAVENEQGHRMNLSSVTILDFRGQTKALSLELCVNADTVLC